MFCNKPFSKNLLVGYLCEGRWSFQCIGYDYTAYMDYMDLTVRCPRKAVGLIHSLAHPPLLTIRHSADFAFNTLRHPVGDLLL